MIAPSQFEVPAGSDEYYQAKARHYVSKEAKLTIALKNADVDDGLTKLDPDFEVVFDGYVETRAMNLRLIKICRKGFINSANIGVEVIGPAPAGVKTVRLAEQDLQLQGMQGAGLGSVRVATFKGIEQSNLETDDIFVAITR